MSEQEQYNTLTEQTPSSEETVARVRELIIFNDDYHTFDFVIDSLIEICNHDELQAEQCTFIIHHNGKCSVKSGSYTKLNPMRVALCDRGLSAVIE
jgi:ATP-dependent Clp protease adaptor protein ClpS